MAINPKDNPFDPAYVKKRKPVLLIVAGVAASMALLFSAFFYVIVVRAKNSEPYRLAISEIAKDRAIAEKIGGIKEYGFLPVYNISTVGDTGTAFYMITVIGNKSETKVYVSLEKQSGQSWQISELYDIAAQEEPIQFEDTGD